jgi:hypothetical protein
MFYIDDLSVDSSTVASKKEGGRKQALIDGHKSMKGSKIHV